MTLEIQLQLLKNTSIFRDVLESDLLELLRQSRAKTFQIGETVYLEGDVASNVFVVSSGYFKTFSSSPDGARELTLSVEGSRQILGLVAAFLEPKIYAASCVVLETGVLICIPNDVFQRALERSPNLAKACLQFLASRHTKLIRRTEQLFFSELNHRLAVYLLEHASIEGFQLPTNSELASQIGTVPELVSRKLGEFYRQGFTRLEKRRVWLENIDALKFSLGIEFPLYSDAHITGEYINGLGPYSFLNTVPYPDGPGIVNAPIILRVSMHLGDEGLDLSKKLQTSESLYHGGSFVDEIAAVTSLCLGARIRAGEMCRRFEPGDDPLGRPTAWDRKPKPILNF
jgi:CRP/FNR family transcriptional regulator, dissimilatory nitrate respiration regulator